jgi:hypothetical protein
VSCVFLRNYTLSFGYIIRNIKGLEVVIFAEFEFEMYLIIFSASWQSRCGLHCTKLLMVFESSFRN